MESKDQDQTEMEPELTPQDEVFAEKLAQRLGQPFHPGLCLSAEAVSLLSLSCSPAPVDLELLENVIEQMERTARDLEYEAEVRARKEEPSLGSYFLFLRSQSGLTADQAAAEADWDFQDVKALERNRLSPRQIPAGRFIALARALRASLATVERLLPKLVRAPRYQFAGAHDRLYRGARGATGAASEGASLAARGEAGRRFDNPEYQEEVEAVRLILQQLRTSLR